MIDVKVVSKQVEFQITISEPEFLTLLDVLTWGISGKMGGRREYLQNLYEKMDSVASTCGLHYVGGTPRPDDFSGYIDFNK